jgi:membrane associated rhomboid family serine protease
MFPLRDVIPSRTTPWITFSLTGVNVLVFLHMLQLRDRRDEFVAAYGLIPVHFSWVSAVTSIFLHAGWLQLVSNIWALWIFGDNVEDRMGHGRFLVFYLLAGLVAGLAQTYADPYTPVPLVGASGAVAGVLGAYLVLFPQSRVLVLVFPLVFVDVIEISAIFFLGLWFVLQLLSGATQNTPMAGADIGFWTDVGGFLTGVVGVWVFKRPERLNPDWWGEPG